MQPDKLSICDLFQKERRYVVPLYQRAYVWNEDDQWQPLWEAVGHFMMAFEPLFLLALFTLILGNGAFKPNISTQVGGLYAG